MKRLALLLGLSVSLCAQSPHGQPGMARPMASPPRPMAPPPRSGNPTREMIQNPHFMTRLYQIRVNSIVKGLGLPEDRARVVAERWSRWDREHLDRGEQAGNIRRQFNQVLVGPGTEEEKNAQLKPLLDQFMTLRAQQEAGRKQFEEDIRSGLSPAQQARLILVMEEIQQRLRESLREVRER